MLRHGSKTLQKRFDNEVDAARWINEQYAFLHPNSKPPNSISNSIPSSNPNSITNPIAG
jgi:hypothetical protein